MKILPVAYQALVVLIVSSLHTVHTACSVSMNEGLPDPQPLILTPDGSPDVFGFKLPADEHGNLLFDPGEEVRLLCPGPSNSFLNLPTLKDIRIRCDSGATFLHDDEARHLSFFACSQVPRSATRETAMNCTKRGTIFEIGFEITSTEFLKLIEVCFDKKKLNNLWSKVDVVSVIAGRQFGFDSEGSALTEGTLYPGLDPDNLYTTQTDTIGRIIGRLQAEHFINSTYHLTTGLLSDGPSFLYRSLQLTTMHYINSAPQWNYLKTGMWDLVEKDVRFHAQNNNVNLVVYTGTYNATTLPDDAKIPKERELYLSITEKKDKTNRPIRTYQMAVPAVFWKVVYEPVSKKAVAIVAINNPYKDRSALEGESERYNLCARKVYTTSWYICAAGNRGYGFGYCCEVDEFRRSVKSLPAFEVTGFLT